MKKKIIAVVLCGGFGSRISELTTNTPKSLIKIKNKPLIWYSINSLLKSGIKDIILPLGYKGESIRKYVLKNFKKNLDNIRLIDTGEKTEIFQRILKIKKQLIGYDSFIIINSDTLFDFKLKKLINFHYNNKYNISLSGIKMRTSWGSILLKKNNSVYKFKKNNIIDRYYLKNDSKYKAFRNTGITIINSNFLRHAKKINKKTDFEDFFYNKKNIGSLIFDGFWYPVETYKDFLNLKKNRFLLKKVVKLFNRIK